MALSASTTIDASVDRVAAIFCSEDFVRHTSELVGGTLESFVVDGPLSGAFTTTTVRTLPTDRLPDMARTFVGSMLKVTQVDDWAAPAANGARTATIKLTVAGAPLDVTAQQSIVAEGDGARVDLTGEVTSPIPFLGAKIASAAEPMIGKALNIQATQAREWLQTH